MACQAGRTLGQTGRTLRQADNATFKSDPINHSLPESMADGMVLAQTIIP